MISRCSVVVRTHLLVSVFFEVTVTIPRSEFAPARSGKLSLIEEPANRNCDSKSKSGEEKRHEKMCYPAKCRTCGQTTWAGCGKHVPSVFEKIPKGQACMCKDWPGVVFPKETPKEDKSEAKETSAPAVAET